MDDDDEPFTERRTDRHKQMLVDVGIVLCRCNGLEYAQTFLEKMKIPQTVIERVLAKEAVRPGMHISLVNGTPGT